MNPDALDRHVTELCAAHGIEREHLCWVSFVPLVEEDYFLVCLVDALEQPAVRSLRDALASQAWAAALASQPGYARSPSAGQVLSLTRALPWWRFRTGRHGSATA